MRNHDRHRGASDHGGDGGYQHCCQGCNSPFFKHSPSQRLPVGAETATGDYCIQCTITFEIPSEFHTHVIQADC